MIATPKLKKKKKNPVPYHYPILTGKKKNKLVRIRTSHRMQAGQSPCHCRSSNFHAKAPACQQALCNERSAYSSPKPRAADNRQNADVRNCNIRRRGKFRIQEQFDRHLIVLQIVRRISWKSCCAKIEC
jgi:hypothetical protein